MTLRASIQIPVNNPRSLAYVLAAVQHLGETFVKGHSAMKHPFGFQLSPQGVNFIAEIIVPLDTREEIERALDTLVELDLLYLKTHPGQPKLYQSGTRYKDPGKLAWYTAPILLDKRAGDCKDLCGLRVAELILQGEDARPHLKRVNESLWHVQVRRGNGSIEDPSRILGMR
jgi:hypothetical protein